MNTPKKIDWKFILFMNMVMLFVFSTLGLKYLGEDFQLLNMFLYIFFMLVIANSALLFSAWIVKLMP